MDGKKICNQALLSIGEDIITDESGSDPSSFTGEGRVNAACRELYATCRDALLEMFNWRFAARMLTLDIDDYTYDISGATQADPVVITCAGHPFYDYKHVQIADVEGMTELNGNTYRIANADRDAGTFELQGVDGTGYGAYASGGTVRLRPPFGYEYEYHLPDDFLSDVGIASGEDYEIKEKSLLCNATEVELDYIGRVTDAGQFPSLFITAFKHFLAIPLAARISDSKDWKQIARDEFLVAIGDAGQANAFKGKPDQTPPDNDWQSTGRY